MSSGIYRSASNHAQSDFYVTVKCNPIGSYSSFVSINTHFMPSAPWLWRADHSERTVKKWVKG